MLTFSILFVIACYLEHEQQLQRQQLQQLLQQLQQLLQQQQQQPQHDVMKQNRHVRLNTEIQVKYFDPTQIVGDSFDEEEDDDIMDQITLPQKTHRHVKFNPEVQIRYIEPNYRVRFNPVVQVKYVDPEPNNLAHIKVIGDSFGKNDDFKVLQFLENLYWKAIHSEDSRIVYSKIRQKKIKEAQFDLKAWRMENQGG
ncbi:15068_t:CDS:2 [Cetraspora pellucida]|uniref:15068_t:CDS:1 n=1 Tax=Cetraspora pellucida TaxID=1433469 RepID=A0A9N9CVS0_9GLOM|nr:15068_t:CDS:2 [Cetraspora pellucida]